jgi:lysophospholipase L1-like esterase
MITKSTRHSFLFILLIGAGVFQPLFSQDSSSGNGKIRFRSDIEIFLKNDSTSPPPLNSIEFIGSSIFRRWDKLKEQMAPLPVYNRAFGGSRTHEVLFYMDKIVFPYKPRIIVYYCGSNDAGGSVPVAGIVSNIKKFFERVHQQLPETKLFFVSINRSPKRKSMWVAIDSTNAIIKKYCSASSKREFIDVNPVLFDAAGNPRLELYLDDQLHFKDEAYGEFTKIIKPILLKEWSRK